MGFAHRYLALVVKGRWNWGIEKEKKNGKNVGVESTVDGRSNAVDPFRPERPKSYSNQSTLLDQAPTRIRRGRLTVK
jgi:hypothetical protein